MTQKTELERTQERDRAAIDPEEYARLKLIYEITRQFQGTLNIKVLMNKILTRVLDELEAEAGTFFMVDEAAKEIVCTEALGPAREKVLDLRIPLGTGVVGWCVKTRKPTIIYDTSKDKRFHFDVDEQTGFVTRSVICVPIVHNKKALGAVELFNKKSTDGTFTDHDMEILKIIADNAAAILNTAKIHEVEKKLRERTTIMNEFARAFNETLALDTLLSTVFTKTVAAFDCEAGSIWLVDDEEPGKIACRVADGPGKNQILGAKLPIGTGIVGNVVQNKKMEMILDAEQDERFMSAVDEKTGFKTISMLCVPLMDGEKCIGCIQVINKKSGNHKFSRDDVDLLRGVAAIAGVSIKNAQVFEKESKIRELSGLLKISREINASLDYDSVAVSVVNLTSRLIEYRRAILLSEVKPGTFSITAVSGMAGNFKTDPALSHLESIAGLILEGKEENYFPRVEEYLKEPTAVEQFKEYFRMTEVKSFFARKIADGEGTLGILIFEGGGPNVVPADKHDMLDILWNQVAVSLRNAQLYRSVPKFDLFRSKKGKSYKWPVILGGLAAFILALAVIPIRYTVSAEAEVVPLKKRFIYPEVDGLLKKMCIDDGDMVREGQVIARIDDKDLVFERDKLMNRVTMIEQEIRKFRMEGNLIELTDKQNELRQVRGQIEDVKARIGHTDILAPLSGQIILKDAASKQGEFVSRGSKFGEVVDLSRVKVKLLVPEDQVKHVEKGQDINIKFRAFPMKIRTSLLEYLAAEGELNEVSGSYYYPAYTILDNDGFLLKVSMGGHGRIKGRKMSTLAYIFQPLINYAYMNYVW